MKYRSAGLLSVTLSQKMLFSRLHRLYPTHILLAAKIRWYEWGHTFYPFKIIRCSNALIKTGLTHKLFAILQIPRFRFNNCWGANQIWGAALAFVLQVSPVIR